MKYLNKIIPPIIILFYLVITSQNTIAYLYFKINQNYIAKNLCVQKDAEDNLCMGSCYLKAIQERVTENKDKENNATPVKYNSSNSIQEYVSTVTYKIYKTEFFIIFNNHKFYKLLRKDYKPITRPPIYFSV